MSRKSPAPTGAKITTADIEAAERARVTAMALKRQQPAPPPLTPEQEHAAALFDRLERRPSAEELANQQVQARLQDVARRNAEGAEANRAYAARIRASGYQGWTEGER